MATRNQDYLLAVEAAGKTFADLAVELEQTEMWLARVLTGTASCTPAQAARIAELLGIDSERTASLVNLETPGPDPSPWKKLGEQLLDKVLIGAAALVVALIVQQQFATVTIGRERALAVSNVRSQFLIERYTQVRSGFAGLLAQLEDTRRLIDDDINSDEARRAAEAVGTMATRLEVDANVIASAHPDTTAAVEAFKTALRRATEDLAVRTLPADYESRLAAFRRQFFALGDACQAALVDTVEGELEQVEERRLLW